MNILREIDECFLERLIWTEETGEIDEDCFSEYLLNSSLSYDHGYTKFVFTNLDPNYVIKMPIMFRKKDGIVESSANNFCDIEYKNFLKARLKGLDCFFAPIDRVARSINDSYYFQRRITNIVHPKNYVENSKKEYCKLLNSNKQLNDLLENYKANKMSIGYLFNFNITEICVMDLFLQYYSPHKLLELSLFLEENNIDDLSYNNVGMLNGKPVFFDYSGI